MKVLSLDISTKTGWALFDVGQGIKLLDYGLLLSKEEGIKYDKFDANSIQLILKTVDNFSSLIKELIIKASPDLIVVEQTNLGRQRIVQKLLEWLHFCCISIVRDLSGDYPSFIDSSEWRKIVNLKLTKEDKDRNKALKKCKGRGKINKKHLAVRIANELFKSNLKEVLKMKDNDIADAILIGLAFCKLRGLDNG